jgi:hypothetical protein
VDKEVVVVVDFEAEWGMMKGRKAICCCLRQDQMKSMNGTNSMIAGSDQATDELRTENVEH